MENKIAVIYKSKYGATKRYSGWLALKLNADLYEVSDIGKKDLKNYDTIIYGGGLYIGKIKGIKFIINNYENIKNKKVIVFMVGIKNLNSANIKSILEKNIPKKILSNIDTFYFRGKINYNELSFKDKILINVLKINRLKENEINISDDKKMSLDIVDNPIDYTDKKSIDILLNNIFIKC